MKYINLINPLQWATILNVDTHETCRTLKYRNYIAIKQNTPVLDYRFHLFRRLALCALNLYKVSIVHLISVGRPIPITYSSIFQHFFFLPKKR